VSVAWDEAADLYGVANDIFHAFPQRLAEYARVAPGERVLDLGSGNGLGIEALARTAEPGCIAAVDFSERMLRAARARVLPRRSDAVVYVRGDVRALPVRDGWFDVAFASTVLQFVRYSVDALREWRRVLAADGRLVFCVPGGGDGPDVSATLVDEFFARLSADVRRRLLAEGPPPPLPDLAEQCGIAGFTTVELGTERFPATLASADEWWSLQWTHGFRVFLREFDDATLREMRDRAFELLAPLQEPSGAIAGVQSFVFGVARV
jgi:SAM-dependent methyltransferase